MDTTPNLALPYIMPSQAQKHVTHNEAIRALDAIVQIGVDSRSTVSPPASPSEGQRFIVAPAANGDWSGKDDMVAAFQDGAWAFYQPLEGWTAWISDEDILAVRSAGAWMIAGGKTGQFDTVSVNGAVADVTNRLAVSSSAALFDHDGADHRLKINKSGVSDTASVLFQTAYSGRAEFGLTGDDNWRVKVSADGTNWSEAITVDAATANVGIGVAAPSTVLHVGGLMTSQKSGSGAGFIANRSDGKASSLQAGSSACRLNFEDSGDFVISSNSRANILAGTGGGAGQDFITAEMATGNVLLVSESGGDVGIGTASPTTKLDVDGPVRCKTYTVAGTPSPTASGAGAMIFVSDETGGAVLAFSDGSNWRRVTDRAVIA